MFSTTAGALTAATGARRLPEQGEYILRGGYILTMDPSLGEYPRGDVHVKKGEIVAVGTSITVPGATVIDASGTIVMPGFVDTHQHLWTSVLRGSIRGDDPKFGYFPSKARAGARMTPEDIYNSVCLGVVEGLSSGITTVHDFCHNVPSPAHAAADLKALNDLGVRARLSYGRFGEPSPVPMDWQDVARVKNEVLPKSPLLSLGVIVAPTMEKDGSMRASVLEDLRTSIANARALDLPYTLHYGNLTHGIIDIMAKNNWLTRELLLVHPQGFTAPERQLLVANQVGISIAPSIEIQYSTVRSGYTQFAEMEALGAQMGLSVDSAAASANANFFNEMRALLWAHRTRSDTTVKLTPRRLVELATIDGAKTLGLADRVGSLTPGKRADIVLIRTDDINIAPVIDPFNSLVYSAQPSNVDTVMVDGRILRRGGKFMALDMEQVIRDATRSALRLRSEAGLA
ncbi:amidohydrolase family protein [Ralstonia soli]|uniref:Amidohydrolase family protein n=1 Tax=Ralstonia soli TaxID=2953896 RepID=A0ABT1AKX5_9RALS|nr:amidohydrolase family protein [Ralstonia soli]MCO5399082.1 amidohydrolase family protein [Ralstonia soli]